MSHFLMWEFKDVDVGRFHSANGKTEQAEMIAKGYQDITRASGLDLKFPTGKPIGKPKATTRTLKSSKTTTPVVDTTTAV